MIEARRPVTPENLPVRRPADHELSVALYGHHAIFTEAADVIRLFIGEFPQRRSVFGAECDAGRGLIRRTEEPL